MQLHTADGMRKYLTAGERDGFLRAAEQADRPVRTLCMTLPYAGCRLSEALALIADRVDMEAGVLVFESLKSAAPALAVVVDDRVAGGASGGPDLVFLHVCTYAPMGVCTCDDLRM